MLSLLGCYQLRLLLLRFVQGEGFGLREKKYPTTLLSMEVIQQLFILFSFLIKMSFGSKLWVVFVC